MSRLPFELFLALRYLRPKRTFVSIITLISVIGVTLGVSVLIVVISVMSGFDKELREKILGFNAHMRVTSPVANGLSNYKEIADDIAKNPNVTGVAPYVMTQVLLDKSSEDNDSLGAMPVPLVKGVDTELEGLVSVLPDKIISGSFNLENNGVLIGSRLARSYGLEVGDLLTIYSVKQVEDMKRNLQNGNEEFVPPDDFEIRGIFDLGYYQYDQLFIACSLEDSQEFLGFEYDDLVTGLTVMIENPNDVGVVRGELIRDLEHSVRIETWTETNRDMLDALVVEKNVMFYILFFIMIVAAFGITSALITFVVQKTREIGILKALGASNLQIVLLFLGQSFAVGVVGVIGGFCVGLLALEYRNEFLLMMRNITGSELFPASIYNFSSLPALIVRQDIAIICGASLVICIVAGVIPAWSAGKLRPLEALRRE
jgi:lipoprotein-releasing system permease protein